MTGELAIRDERQYLATVAEVRSLAEKITNVEDAKTLADRARVLQVWAQRQRLGLQKVNLAAAAHLWAKRREGELLAEMRANGERARSSGETRLESPLPTLDTLGVTKHEASECQRLAAIPVERFASVVDELIPEGRITQAELERRAGRHERDERIRDERERAEAAARAFIAGRGEAACRIEVGDVASWRPPRFGISCIVTDPPYVTADAVELHSRLADFAIDVLPAHGALVVMTWQPLLPAVLEAMARPRLVWRWMACWQFATTQRTPERVPRVFDGWKPILVFHKDGWDDDTTYLYDVVVSRDADKSAHEWGQNVGGFRQLVRAVSAPGETVCDPFLGGGTTAVAALAEARLFVGCDVDERAVAAATRRLAA